MSGPPSLASPLTRSHSPPGSHAQPTSFHAIPPSRLLPCGVWSSASGAGRGLGLSTVGVGWSAGAGLQGGRMDRSRSLSRCADITPALVANETETVVSHFPSVANGQHHQIRAPAKLSASQEITLRVPSTWRLRPSSIAFTKTPSCRVDNLCRQNTAPLLRL